MGKKKLILLYLLLLIGIDLFVLAGFWIFWSVRPNTVQVNEDLTIQSWRAFEEEYHNSNTNLKFWNGNFYLVHQSSPHHWASPVSKIIVRRSSNALDFSEIVAEFDSEGLEIRDPKLGAIDGKLFVYALPNEGILGLPLNIPYKTVYSYTTDGISWTNFTDLTGDIAGWNMWAPKTNDGSTWYVTAHDIDSETVALFKTKDGIEWTKVSNIVTGGLASESALDFTKDGKIVVASRCEMLGLVFGDIRANTIVSYAEAPYTDWSTQINAYVTKLDGPAIFYNPIDGENYAIGRFEPEAKGVFTATGSMINKKRTSIFLLDEEKGLTYLSDLPSGGDTAYVGAVVKGSFVYLSYYTSHIDTDYVWLQGMGLPSYIRIAKISLGNLASVAHDPPALPVEGFALDNTFFVIAYCAIAIAGGYFFVKNFSRKKSKTKSE